MVDKDSAERINRVLVAATGPFRTRGRPLLRYDESKWYAALDVMPELTVEDRRHVVAVLKRSKTKHEQDAAWLRTTAYTGVAGAFAGALALEGNWRAVAFPALVGFAVWIQGRIAETHEPVIAYTEGLLAALAETPPRGDT